ncbi:MAG: hypothetical protein JW776_08690 [Candidatus Lokiarchaeota archaeon]|nr:hypothetical protein [Candidatus Lokiarchaeota archaeon]
MQLFTITQELQAKAVKAQNLVSENLREDGVYLIVDDNKKVIWIYKGHKSPLLLQIYGAVLQNDMRIHLKVYHSNDLNKFHRESEIYREVMDAIVKSGLAPELSIKQKIGEKIQVLTYMGSRGLETCVHSGLIAKEIIPEVLEFENPPGFIRHMSLITGSMYHEDIEIQKFITESKEKTALKKIGTLPNGFYFLEDMSTRLFIKDGKVACLDFMIEKDKDLGENRVLVPILHREKMHREGNLDILLDAFKAPQK